MKSVETTRATGNILHVNSAILSRDLFHSLPKVVDASGIYYFTADGTQIIDACGGSAVVSVGHNNKDVQNALLRQMQNVTYCHSQFFTTQVSEDLANAVIATTNGEMARLLTLSSGSEAVETALKVARQYFLELPQPEPKRTNFIARIPSYHGATVTALGVGGHLSRRQVFSPLFATNAAKVSQCHEYRDLRPGETRERYVARLSDELDAAFQSYPAGTVCAFIAETVTGASTGSVTAVDGYFPAVAKVCQKYGALLILDEVMCGMGRTGTMHAWAQENVVPNIQIIGKGFGGGYAAVSGVLIDQRVNSVFESGSGKLIHGQSFQGHPVASAAALETLNIIHRDNLLTNVSVMGCRLASRLRGKLASHPHVGDIRGRGLFWSIEFVKDKQTKTSFDPAADVGYSVHEFALQSPYNLCVYPGKGSADGVVGDHVLLAPPFTVSADEVDLIVDRLAAVVECFFSQTGKMPPKSQSREW